MSYEKVEGSFIFFCDSCPNEHDTDTDNFLDAIENMKEAGWVSDKIEGTYYHTCNNCKKS